jgi:WD40 repeat protein
MSELLVGSGGTEGDQVASPSFSPQRLQTKTAYRNAPRCIVPFMPVQCEGLVQTTRLGISYQDDSFLGVYKADSGALLRGLSGHQANITCLAAYQLPPEQAPCLVSGDSGGFLRVWDGEALITGRRAHDGALRAIYISSEPGSGAPRVVTGGDDHFIRVWGGRVGQKLREMDLADGVVALAGHLDQSTGPPRHRVVASTEAGIMYVLDPEEGRILRQFGRPAEHIPRGVMCFESVTGEWRVVSHSASSAVRVWGMDSDDEPVLVADDDPQATWGISAIDAYADPQEGCDRLITGTRSGMEINIWDASSGKKVRRMP